MKSEFGIYIRDRSTITFKILVKDRRLNLKFTVFAFRDAVTRIGIIISQGIWLKNRVELFQILRKNVGSIQTDIELAKSI